MQIDFNKALEWYLKHWKFKFKSIFYISFFFCNKTSSGHCFNSFFDWSLGKNKEKKKLQTKKFTCCKLDFFIFNVFVPPLFTMVSTLSLTHSVTQTVIQLCAYYFFSVCFSNVLFSITSYCMENGTVTIEPISTKVYTCKNFTLLRREWFHTYFRGG